MTNQDCFVLLQHNAAHLHPSARELIGKARELIRDTGGRVCGILLDSDPEQAQRSVCHLPLDCVYFYQTDSLDDPQLCAASVTNCVRENRPSMLLIPGTAFGRAIAPRVAVACKTGLTADCTELNRSEQGLLIQIRPAFGGDVMAQIVTEHARPQMATVRPGILEPCALQPGHRPTLIEGGRGASSVIQTLWSEHKRAETAGIAEQKILIAVGRGVKKAEDLELFRTLAQRMGGTLACSRALVEQGFLPHEYQIGLSGTSVHPELLLTFGISGSVQFLAGAKRAKTILAVNSSPDARIFRYAQVPICGDLYEIAAALLRKLEKGADQWN